MSCLEDTTERSDSNPVHTRPSGGDVRGISLTYIPVLGRHYLVMKQLDILLQFLRSPTWRAHTIRTAEEAYIDLLACDEDEHKKNYTTLGKRWNVSRQFAKRICDKLQTLGLIDITDEGVILNNMGVIENNTQCVIENNTVTEDNTPPSRVIKENNISNILPPPENASVREEDIPRAEDVQSYINQIGGALFTGQAFVDYHTAKCLWNSRNIRPRVWQAMVRTWRERDKQRTINNPSPHAQSSASNYHPSSREAERQQQNADTRRKIVERYLNTTEDDYIFPKHLL